MEIISFQDKHIQDVVQLWNKACVKDMPYKPFTEDGFEKKFIQNPHFSYEGTFVGMEDGKVIGFANGIYKKIFLPGETHENTPGYLTMVLVDEDYRNKGYGSALLKKVEDFLIQKGKKQIQVIFFNPINLEWNIPATQGHDHNNAPGVDIDSLAYEFLLKRGYEQRTKEVAMYLPLDKFHLEETMIEKAEQLKQKGISIEYYDEKKHDGFDGFFDEMKNELWRKEVKDHLAMDPPHPVIVVSDQGKICGFTGPIAVQESGRGWFAGIGVDPQHGGMGIGTLLFFMLCDSFKKEGAKFMSLFTGVENKARRMYEKAGFDVVKTWAVLRKEI